MANAVGTGLVVISATATVVLALVRAVLRCLGEDRHRSAFAHRSGESRSRSWAIGHATTMTRVLERSVGILWSAPPVTTGLILHHEHD